MKYQKKKKIEYNEKALNVYRNEVARYEAESSDMKKLYWTGRIGRGQYYGWKWRYDAAKIRLQEVENESKVLSSNTELREKEKNNIFAGTIIAVEFDGIIAHTAYPKILSPVYETIEFLWKAKSDGAIIILWTCREGEALKQAVEWCEKTGVPIDYVNENAPERAAKYGNNSRKISADIYIDDRAVGIADIDEYENAEELRFNPNHDPENGRFTSNENGGNGVDFSGESGIIKLDDIEIGKSLSAKAKNYDVMDLQTGEIFHFVEGTKIQDAKVFAGKGSKTVFQKADKYAERYGGNPSEWQHCKGNGILDFYGEERKAEVHWVQCESAGKHEFFVKEWFD